MTASLEISVRLDGNKEVCVEGDTVSSLEAGACLYVSCGHSVDGQYSY